MPEVTEGKEIPNSVMFGRGPSAFPVTSASLSIQGKKSPPSPERSLFLLGNLGLSPCVPSSAAPRFSNEEPLLTSLSKQPPAPVYSTK